MDVCEWLELLPTKIVYYRDRIMACCPFHDDRNPSMQVWPFKGEVYCYNPQCIAHKGHVDIINMTAWRWGISNQQAIQVLAREII